MLYWTAVTLGLALAVTVSPRCGRFWDVKGGKRDLVRVTLYKNSAREVGRRLNGE